MQYLEQLQALDEPTKLKVLVAATAVIMIVVVYFWLAYFNNIVGEASQSASVSATVPAAVAPAAVSAPIGTSQPSGGSGGGNIFVNSYNFFKNIFAGAVHGLENIVNAQRQYIVKP